MARILFCWELGGALGHIATVHTLAARLHALGHELHLATGTAIVPHAPPVSAALHTVPAWRPMQPSGNVRTFAHILRNVGYGDRSQLSSRLRAWQEIFRLVRPEVLVCETSPTALLAARAMNVPTVNIGTGFSIPTRRYPLCDLHHWNRTNPDALAGDEDRLTQSINRALAAERLPPLQRLHEMFETVCTAVCSVPELDAYDARPLESYVGELARLPGLQLDWPGTSSRRVFAYLRMFPELPQLLAELRRRDVSVVIYGPSLPRELVRQYECDRLRFAERPLDVRYMLRTASLVVTHGHGLTLQALQAGVPILCFPLLLEQHIVARRVATSNVGAFCSPWGSNRIAATLDALLGDATFAQRAQLFASRYSHLDPDTQATQLAGRIAMLAT